MTRRASKLDELEPEGIATLNPQDMKMLGIEPGEKIVIATRRGEVIIKCRPDPDTKEGMVFIPFCFAESPANVLTNPQIDPTGKIPEFKYCACRVEKVTAIAEVVEAAE